MVWREVFDLFRDCSFQTQEREMFVEYNLQPKLTVNQLVVQLVNFGNKNENNQGVPVHTHGVVFKHQSEEQSVMWNWILYSIASKIYQCSV